MINSVKKDQWYKYNIDNLIFIHIISVDILKLSFIYAISFVNLQHQSHLINGMQSQQTTAAQYERPGSPISGLAEPNQASITHEGTTMSSSHVNHQAVDVTGVPETTHESFSFGTTSHGNLSFDTHPFF